MTKKSKSKMEARARKAKFGGKHEAHVRLVREAGRSSPGPFEQYVFRVIELARARAEEEDSLSEGPIISAASVLKRLRGPVPPAEAALRTALHEASPLDARKLEVVMYVGRDVGRGPGDFPEVFEAMERTVPRDSYEITLSMIREKMPLDEYLTHGLREARRLGFDIESAFARPAVRTPTEGQAT